MSKSSIINSNWKLGDPVVSPVGEMTGIDPQNVKSTDIYKLLIGTIIPRPIAFVSTIGANGTGNLAPFSFFNGISSKPPCLMISITRKPNGDKKDSLRNIEETGEFVVNASSEWLFQPLVETAAAYPYGVDEMRKVGLTPIPSLRVKPPRVKEAAVHFECKVIQNVQIGDGTLGSSNAIFGEIVYVHAMKEAYREGKIDPQVLKPLARLGGSSYTLLGDILDKKIPDPS